MKLNELIYNEEIIDGNVKLEMEIGEIKSDSKKIQKNGVFVAIKGEARDGNEYINDAVKNGASVVITEEKPKNNQIPYILVKNARSIISKMYSRYYGLQDYKPKIIAVTGTNGKSTASYFIYNILMCVNKSCAEGMILGTAAKMFTIAGPVSVYGISASVVYGIIYWITTLF